MTELLLSGNIMIDFKTVMVILRSILVQRKQDYGTQQEYQPFHYNFCQEQFGKLKMLDPIELV